MKKGMDSFLGLAFWTGLVALGTSSFAAGEGDPARVPIAPEKIQAVGNSVEWQKLIHYNRFLPGLPLKGEVDGDWFYFSPNGRHDPVAELEANVIAFEKNAKTGKLDQSMLCAFPERRRFLNEKLGTHFKEPSPGECPHYEGYLSRMSPQGVSLVFSSAYASNPGSMFGHTLLKIDTGRKSDLLHRSISFAAAVRPDENGLLYVVNGLLGGYIGQFGFMPYNEKVQEYINAESRDLWEYQLNLTKEESKRLVDHIWELESNSWFDYYFTNKNCSYQLLTALEVVKPEWDLSSGWLWVVPAETVKRVGKISGAITSVRYRPSLRRRTMQAIGLLNESERQEFQQILGGSLPPSGASSPQVLTALISTIQYHRAESIGTDRKDLHALWDPVLQRRSQLPKGTAIDTYQKVPEVHPEDGHGPIRVGLGGGVMQRSGSGSVVFQQLHLKPAYHDLMNDDRGYPNFSEFDFPNLTMRYYPEKRSFQVDHFQFFAMTNIFPFSFLEKRSSWKGNVELFRPRDQPCDECMAVRAEGSWGGALELGGGDLVAYSLVGGYFDLGSIGQDAARVGPSLETGVLVRPLDFWKLRIKSTLYGDFLSKARAPVFGVFSAEQSFSFSKHWDLRAEVNSWLPLVRADISYWNFFDFRAILHYYF